VNALRQRRGSPVIGEVMLDSLHAAGGPLSHRGADKIYDVGVGVHPARREANVRDGDGPWAPRAHGGRVGRPEPTGGEIRRPPATTGQRAVDGLVSVPGPRRTVQRPAWWSTISSSARPPRATRPGAARGPSRDELAAAAV